MKEYQGFIPPCAIFCGECPYYIRERNPCPGAEIHCKARKCKTIYVCCIEGKGLNYCYECGKFPCRNLRNFAEIWEKNGQDLIQNQKELKRLGQRRWLDKWNKRSPNTKNKEV